jgi:hypothetical protein
MEKISKYTKLLAAVISTLIILSSAIIWLNRDRIIENDDFFTLSIGEVPEIDSANWSLRVDGLADNPFNLNLTEIMAMPKTVQVSTIKCVEGPFGTAEWGGVSLAEILGLAETHITGYDVIIYSVDGFSTSLSLEDATADGVILAYEMNGETLPANQGYPLRLVVPEKYGYKWAKWINHIEIVDYDHLGFWESRGWDDDATISSYKDWGWHAVLLTASTVFCGLGCISGVKFDPKENFWTDLPAIFSKKFHTWSSIGYIALALPTFSGWAYLTYMNRGAVFYSGHGTLALIVAVLTTISLVTGIIAMRWRRNFRHLHLMVSTLCFFILVGTIMVGLFLITGTVL